MSKMSKSLKSLRGKVEGLSRDLLSLEKQNQLLIFELKRLAEWVRDERNWAGQLARRTGSILDRLSRMQKKAEEEESRRRKPVRGWLLREDVLEKPAAEAVAEKGGKKAPRKRKAKAGKPGKYAIPISGSEAYRRTER